MAAADNAFSLAAAASSALSKSPLDDNVKSLAGYLFTDSKLTDVSSTPLHLDLLVLTTSGANEADTKPTRQ